MSTDISQATIDQAAARARHEAAALLTEVNAHGWKRADLARDAANNLTVLRLVEGDTEWAHVYARAAVLLTEVLAKALRVSMRRSLANPPAGTAERLIPAVRSAHLPSSSSVAGLASLRRGAAMAGTAYPRPGELPCGHRSPCVACTPDGVIS